MWYLNGLQFWTQESIMETWISILQCISEDAISRVKTVHGYFFRTLLLRNEAFDRNQIFTGARYRLYKHPLKILLRS